MVLLTPNTRKTDNVPFESVLLRNKYNYFGFDTCVMCMIIIIEIGDNSYREFRFAFKMTMEIKKIRIKS